MATFTAAERQSLAKKGYAMPGGEFPIRPGNRQDLENAIHDIGRANDPVAAKRHIIRRARAMQMKDALPLHWL